MNGKRTDGIHFPSCLGHATQASTGWLSQTALPEPFVSPISFSVLFRLYPSAQFLSFQQLARTIVHGVLIRGRYRQNPSRLGWQNARSQSYPPKFLHWSGPFRLFLLKHQSHQSLLFSRPRIYQGIISMFPFMNTL